MTRTFYSMYINHLYVDRTAIARLQQQLYGNQLVPTLSWEEFCVFIAVTAGYLHAS